MRITIEVPSGIVVWMNAAGIRFATRNIKRDLIRYILRELPGIWYTPEKFSRLNEVEEMLEKSIDVKIEEGGY